jgi:acetylornithine deacetylase/succinyl-diaminopimelate desuccinylase-like protein
VLFKRVTVFLFAIFASINCIAQERFLIDWDVANEEALNFLSDLVQIDSSNPPGNETQVVEYLQAVLANEGIESKLFWNDPARKNLVARIRGNGSKRPILIMGHTDVVGVQAENWDEDPFGGLRKDGWLYGRGSLDDKDTVAAGLMVILLLHRNQIELDRDIIFLAEAGEEGTPEVGINYMVENHLPEIAAEFALAEGGGGILENNKVSVVGIQTTEKMPRRVTLVARGTAGHGSRPRPDNAVTAIARAVARAGAWQTEMRLNDTTRNYFERMATIAAPEDARRYRNVANPEETDEIQKHFLENFSYHYSILRTSVVPTIIDGGFRRNVIPSQASATLDIRMLPDEDVEGFYEQLARVIDDSNIEIVPEKIYRPAAPPSEIDNEMFQTLERMAALVYPDALVVPRMSTGATDMSQVRASGTPAYGVAPIRSVAEQESGNGAHSDNERISEKAFTDFLRLIWLTVIEISDSSVAGS